MSISIYSAEDFPKWSVENNCMEDYRVVFGFTIILHAHKWTELEDIYRNFRPESWMENAPNQGKEGIHTGKDLAIRLCGDFGSRGLAYADLDKITDKERETIEKTCEEKNVKFRDQFINRFEQQFRVKMQGGPGRWVPNSYEEECYQLAGKTPPEVVERKQSQKNDVQIIETKIDPEVLAQLVAAEVAKITAPPKR
jgi:hypothetical protein